MTRQEAIVEINKRVEEARNKFRNGEYTEFLFEAPEGLEEEILKDVETQIVESFEEDVEDVDWEIEHALEKYTYNYNAKELELEKKQVTIYKNKQEFIETKSQDTEQRGVRAYADEEIEELINNEDFIKTLENGVVLELAY